MNCLVWHLPRRIVVRDFPTGVGHRDTGQPALTTLHTLRYFYSSLSVRLSVCSHGPHTPLHCQELLHCVVLWLIFTKDHFMSPEIMLNTCLHDRLVNLYCCKCLLHITNITIKGIWTNTVKLWKNIKLYLYH